MLSSRSWPLALLTLGQANARYIGTRDFVQERDTLLHVNATSIVQLATDLSVDVYCLELANVGATVLADGQNVTVPYVCCGTSCAAPVCNQSPTCLGDKSFTAQASGSAVVVIDCTAPTSTASSMAATSTKTSTTLTKPATSSTSSTSSTSHSTTKSTTSSTTSHTSATSPVHTTTATPPSSSSLATTSTAVVSKQSTSASTSPAAPTSSPSNAPGPSPTPIQAGHLPIALVNNMQGSGPINAYITAQDPANGDAVVFLKADGTFFYPKASSAQPQPVTEDIAIPLGATGSTTKVTTPGYIDSARIWFAQGTLTFSVVQGANGQTSLVQPSVSNPRDSSTNTNWGFVELTYSAAELYANLSFVDFVGFILGIKLQSSDGSTATAKGLPQNAVDTICGDLKAQNSKDGQPWDKLCYAGSYGDILRILAPADYLSYDASAFSTYWSSYVDKVWQTYTSEPLKIVTDTSAGTVSCQVQGDTLTCGGGDNRGYAKPTASDIWGCNSGPFAITGADNGVHKAIVPRLCAAFHRSTLLLQGGDTQPSLSPSSYYTVDPTNYYSKFVHATEVDGRGYAFAYDDVKVDNGPDESGSVVNGSPELFTIYAGGGGD